MDLISSDKDEGDEEDMNNSTEEGDVQEDYFDELDTINETLDPNQDIEVVESMEVARNHYKLLNQINKLPTSENYGKELICNDKDENSVHDGEENYLDYSDVESLNEEILEDGTTRMMRTHAKFPRYDENCMTWKTMIYAYLGIKSTYIQETIKAQLELEVTKNQCKKAKAIVMKKLERDMQHEYRKLYDYARALVNTNPGTSIDI
nr:reverse transcriptase domain-containing protein [Tanacetum cinerariifolium]